MSEQRHPRTVRNRDILLLQDVRSIKQEIASLEKRRKWESERRFHITQNFSQSYGGGGTPRGLDDALAAIDELLRDHNRQIKQYERKLRQAEQIIQGIPSTQMRAFVTMLYMDNVPDIDVRTKLNMTRWSFENARKAVEQAVNMRSVKWEDRYTEDVYP